MALPLPDPVIRVGAVSLPGWQTADADALYDAFRDREILRFSWPSVSEYRLEDAQQYLRDQAAGRLAGNQVELAAVDLAGRILGGFSLYRIDQETRNARSGTGSSLRPEAEDSQQRSSIGSHAGDLSDLASNVSN